MCPLQWPSWRGDKETLLEFFKSVLFYNAFRGDRWINSKNVALLERHFSAQNGHLCATLRTPQIFSFNTTTKNCVSFCKKGERDFFGGFNEICFKSYVIFVSFGRFFWAARESTIKVQFMESHKFLGQKMAIFWVEGLLTGQLSVLMVFCGPHLPLASQFVCGPGGGQVKGFP